MDHRLTICSSARLRISVSGLMARREPDDDGQRVHRADRFRKSAPDTYRIDKTMFGSANHQITPTALASSRRIMRCGAILIRASSHPALHGDLHFLPRTPPDRRKLEELTQRIQRCFLLCLNGQAGSFWKHKLAFAAFVGKCSVLAAHAASFSALKRARLPAARRLWWQQWAHRIDAAIFKTRRVSAWKRSALFSRSPVFTNSYWQGNN